MNFSTSESNSTNKKPLTRTILVLLVLGLVVFAAYYLLMAKKGNQIAEKDLNNNNMNAGEWDPDANPDVDSETAEVLAIEDGFEPQNLEVTMGTVVIWNNQSGDVITVDSSPHPAHTDNPILNLGELAPGDKFSLVFDTPGTYKYHNHLDPTQTGVITVSSN